MNRRNRWACILAAATLMAGWSADAAPVPQTPLFAGFEAVADNDSRASLVVDRLVAQGYSVGAPESGLGPYLASQGLTIERWTNAGAPGRPIYARATLIYGKAPWQFSLLVSWRGDAAGRITEIHASNVGLGA